MPIHSLRFASTLSFYGLSCGDMPLKPASDHCCPFIVRKVPMVGHNHLPVVWVILYIDEVLNIFKDDMNETVMICNVALRQAWKHLPNQLLCFTRVMLLCEVKFEFPSS